MKPAAKQKGRHGFVPIPPNVMASEENKKLVAEIEKKAEYLTGVPAGATIADDVLEAAAKAKKRDNGCATEYKAYAVLMKKDIPGGLFILRVLHIKNGRIVKQEDNVEDLAGVQLGKATIGLEEVLG